jgi:hypothetical protein
MSAKKLPVTVEDAKSPEVLQWAHQQLSEGKSWDWIRRELGLGLAADDKRWREIRKQLSSAEAPPTEEGALIDLYEKQLAYQERMMTLLNIITKVVEDEPENKAHRHYVKHNIDLLEKLMKDNHRQFEAVLSVKKAKRGKQSGVKINIYSNVPRPELPVIEVSQNEDDE